MNVCIPIDFRREGGGFYFLEAFRAHLSAHGCAVSRRLRSTYDVLFTNHWMVSPRRIALAVLRNPGVRIVQRIDGAAADYGRMGDADRRQRRVNRWADLTVFQSEYCRYSTREKFAVIEADGPVIHNPVDAEVFRPDGERLGFAERVRVACVTWSVNPRKGAASVYAVAAAHPDVGFVLCGRYPDAPALPNVHRLGVLDRAALAAALRSCHVLLTFSENEACPNHVLEALASGLPVLYHDSGATAEIVGACGLPVTVPTFRAQLDRAMSHHAELASAARRRAVEQFVPRDIFSRYLAELRAAVTRPVRSGMRRRYVRALAAVAAPAA